MFENKGAFKGVRQGFFLPDKGRVCVVARPFKEEEWSLFRDIRLKAMERNTDAYWEQAACEFDYCEPEWRKLLTDPQQCAVGVFAEGQVKPVGLCAFSMKNQEPDCLWAGSAYLDEDYRGVQIMPVIFKKVAQWMMERPKVQFFIAAHRDGNKASSRALEKAGFEYTHTVENAKWLDGGTDNMVFYRAPVKKYLSPSEPGVPGR